MEEMRKALFKQFGKRKAKAAELNMGALAAGYDYAAKNLTKVDPFRVEKMNAPRKNHDEGNAAAALGSMFAGVTVSNVVSDHALLFAGRDADWLSPCESSA